MVRSDGQAVGLGVSVLCGARLLLICECITVSLLVGGGGVYVLSNLARRGDREVQPGRRLARAPEGNRRGESPH